MQPFTMRRFTIWLARAGLLVIALVTFVTSFDAITETAAATGAVSPRLAWAIPIAIDGLILVGSAVAWTEAIDDDWHPFPLLTVGGAAGLSVWANVAHAAGAPLLGQVLAAVPPIALIVSVELGAWQVRRSLKRARHEDEAAAEIESRAYAEAAARFAEEQRIREAEAVLAEDTVEDQPAVDGDGDAEHQWPDADAAPATREDAGTRKPALVAELSPADVARVPAGTRAATAADTVAGGSAQAQDRESDGELMDRIATYVTELGHRPTQREIAETLGLSRASVRRAIGAQPEVWHRLGRLTAAGNGTNNGQGTAAVR